ncbi:MAG TPA: OmpH family outer membrane protein [Thermomicrobiales bacterium]|nr:OmpH family outer membrane protein [Thermomicrobiales bacterium]
MGFLVRAAAAALVMAFAVNVAVPAAHAQAQQQQQRLPTPVVIVVDTNRIMGEARAMKAIRDQIERIRTSFQAEIKRDEDELRRLDQEMAQQRQVLSPEAFNQRRQDLQNRVNTLQQKTRARRQQLDGALRNAMTTVRNTLVRIVQGIAQRNGANLVLQKSDLVFADQRMEFTDEVLRQLDAQLPNVTVEIPRS